MNSCVLFQMDCEQWNFLNDKFGYEYNKLPQSINSHITITVIWDSNVRWKYTLKNMLSEYSTYLKLYTSQWLILSKKKSNKHLCREHFQFRLRFMTVIYPLRNLILAERFLYISSLWEIKGFKKVTKLSSQENPYRFSTGSKVVPKKSHNMAPCKNVRQNRFWFWKEAKRTVNGSPKLKNLFRCSRGRIFLSERKMFYLEPLFLRVYKIIMCTE